MSATGIGLTMSDESDSEEKPARTDHGRHEDRRGEEDMPLHVERFVVEEVLLDYFSAHKQLQGQRGKHVQAETKARYVDEGIVLHVSSVRQLPDHLLLRNTVTYPAEVVQDIPLRLVREDEVGRDGERGARYKRDERGDVRDFVEPIQGWRPQAPVDEKRVVVAHKREANHADCLEDPISEHGEARARVALQFWGDVGSLDEHGSHDNEHADECQSGCAGELVDVAVEGKRVRDADSAEGDDELALGQEVQHGDGV